MSTLSSQVLEKIPAIRLLILDVDGVMTDGKLYFSSQGDAMKTFHARDGLGIKMLLHCGFELAIISGRQSLIVSERAKELGIQHVYQGQKNKVIAYEKCLQHLQIAPEHTAYMGDDINDLPVMQRVGLSIAPADAAADVLPKVDWVCRNIGGQGAVREVCDALLKTQGKWQHAIAEYGH